MCHLGQTVVMRKSLTGVPRPRGATATASQTCRLAGLTTTGGLTTAVGQARARTDPICQRHKHESQNESAGWLASMDFAFTGPKSTAAARTVCIRGYVHVTYTYTRIRVYAYMYMCIHALVHR